MLPRSPTNCSITAVFQESDDMDKAGRSYKLVALIFIVPTVGMVKIHVLVELVLHLLEEPK